VSRRRYEAGLAQLATAGEKRSGKNPRMILVLLAKTIFSVINVKMFCVFKENYAWKHTTRNEIQ
jgi:hypothetical protein